MKKLVSSYVLSFVIAFMLYIIEPVSMFVNNRNDFNFNLSNFLRPLLLIFFIVFIVLSIIYTLIFFINKKFSSKLGFFNVVMIISYILFIWFYIQGNYLASNLPTLDGTVVNWSNYKTENIISIIILLILIGTYVFFLIKYKFEKVIKTSNYITLAIFAMVFVSFIPSIFSADLYSDKQVFLISNEHINDISSQKNFYIFVIDAVDSRTFKESLDESEYKDMFDGFTYYPDTTSMYSFTRDAVPNILSGKINRNEQAFSEFSNNALDESPLFDRLLQENYKINLYEPDLKWSSEKSKNASNLVEYNSQFSSMCYFRNETKYIMYRYLPHFLKSLSKIEYFDLNKCKTTYGSLTSFSFDNIEFYYELQKDVNVIEDNNFSFIHIEGAHVPWKYDENLNVVDESTYPEMVKATLKITNEFLNRIKESGYYDNSIIVVMADHGFQHNNGTRFNPVFLVKGINEHHDLSISNKMVSYDDLMNAFSELMDGKKSNEILSDIGQERKRTFIENTFSNENHMIEYETEGHAWEKEKFVETGRTFDR